MVGLGFGGGCEGMGFLQEDEEEDEDEEEEERERGKV